MGDALRVHETRSAAVADIEALADTTEEILALTIPWEARDRLEPVLRDTAGEDTLVLALLTDVPAAASPGLDCATVVRSLADTAPALGVVDHRAGWSGEYRLLLEETVPDRTISVYENVNIARSLYARLLGTHWEVATETHVADRRSFPATYDRFQRAVIDATIALRDGRTVLATAAGRRVGTDESVTVSGRVVNSRQSYIYPVSTEVPGQNSLVVEGPDGDRTSLGGDGAFIEDVEVFEVTLRFPE